MTSAPMPPARRVARPDAFFHQRPDVRVFSTGRSLACREDPELFFDAPKRHRAIKLCKECPFRGRCGYNAVAVRATHGIWGGVSLPGSNPRNLIPIYENFLAQFEQRRSAEVSEFASVEMDLIDGIADDVDDDLVDDQPAIFHAA